MGSGEGRETTLVEISFSLHPAASAPPTCQSQSEARPHSRVDKSHTKGPGATWERYIRQSQAGVQSQEPRGRISILPSGCKILCLSGNLFALKTFS